MFYIPEDWVKNKNNIETVHEILEKYFYTDLILNDNLELAFKELLDIDETIIVEKIKNGSLTFD